MSNFQVVKSTKSLLLSRSAINNSIIHVQLNTPSNLNALTVEMGEEFNTLMTELSSDTSIRAMILSGSGRAFSAGGDLKFLYERSKISAPKNVESMREFYRNFLSIRNVPFPTIAALNGAAVGAGLCLALACDLRIASSRAKLGLNFTKIGISPGMMGSLTLPSIIGIQAATKMILTGELISANEALKNGMILEVVEDVSKEVSSENPIVEAAFTLAKKISEASPVAVRTSIKMLRNELNVNMESALTKEADAQAICFTLPDLHEGLDAVIDKRLPSFKDFQ